MAPLEPYTYIQCPCADPSTLGRAAEGSSPFRANADDDDEDHAFDPRAPRSNYSLYPLEYLLYCEDCQQIRCDRCVAEEIVTFYCPSCLFEVPSSNLKSEGNRCTRSCFQCPICIGPLAVTSFEAQPQHDQHHLQAPDPHGHGHSTQYILTCSYCNWSSTEIGVKFDKPNSIHSQLAKIRNGGTTRLTAKERKERRKEMAQSGATTLAVTTSGEAQDGQDMDAETQFANLKSFYNSQLHESTGNNGSNNGLSGLGDLGFSSPTSLSRIMSIYTGGGLQDKKAKSRVGIIREALNENEGLKLADLDESGAIDHLHSEDGGYDGTVSIEQLLNQAENLRLGEAPLHGCTRFTSSLRPIPHLLRTKRSKRCPLCRHIISKPEAKVQTTRFRIRLVAGNYIPAIDIRPLNIPGLTPPTPTPQQLALGTTPPLPLPETIPPLKPSQYILTFKNPIFETVRVTLATPATTPGRFASKVTLLCPQFEIDANTDVWDEALKEGGDKEARRRRRGESTVEGPGGQQHQAEAGKIWERGRNWVSTVVEVIPASIEMTMQEEEKAAEEQEKAKKKEASTEPLSGMSAQQPLPDPAELTRRHRISLKEDEDVLEIPVFVRIEWEVEAGGDDDPMAVPKETKGKEQQQGKGQGGQGDGGKEKRELAYWCVLGLGRIGRS